MKSHCKEHKYTYMYSESFVIVLAGFISGGGGGGGGGEAPRNMAYFNAHTLYMGGIL